jgi:hypothetical protein
MSVGELLTLYKDGELNLHPEFQRFFRWSDSQKSRLIESLLLGIPIPPIFVSQDPRGRWDVVDGLQRLSTIFELTGDLTTPTGTQVEPLTLQKTRYLPSLNNMRWGSKDDTGEDILPDPAKLAIKRARLDIKIVLNKSDQSSKYELFDRLNTGGTPATAQEVRNCLLIMINVDFFNWILDLSNDPGFQACVPLTDRQVEEQIPLELVVRFLSLRISTIEQIRSMNDLGPFLTDQITTMAESETFDRPAAEASFRKTFAILGDTLGDDSFRRYNPNKQRSEGAFLISLFETLALGIGFHAADPNYTISTTRLTEFHHTLWENAQFQAATRSGVRSTTRIPTTVILGREQLSM